MNRELVLEPVVNNSGWSVYRIQVDPFPLPEDQRPLFAAFYAALDTALGRAHLQRGLFLQYNQLSLGRSAYTLAERGADWMPAVGLGYEPHKPPPTLWSREEFQNLGLGEMPRPMMHQLFQITKSADAAVAALDQMAGIGPVLAVYAPLPIAEVQAAGTAAFQPLIQEMSLKHFAWYLPLLNLATFGAATSGQMEQWACGLTFCLRENPEDKGVTLASAEPMEPLLDAIGARRDTGGRFIWNGGATS